MTDAEMAAMLGGGKRSGGGMTDEDMAKALSAKPVHSLDSLSADIAKGKAALAAEPSFTDKLKTAGRTIAGGVGAVKESVLHPIDTATNPAKRRELERGIDDMVTAGYGQRFANWAGQKLGDAPDQTLASSEQSDALAAPNYRAGGNLAGSFLPGVASKLAKGGAGLAGRALGTAPTGMVAGAGLGIAKGVAGYEAGAVPLAALQAGARGDNPLEAARAAAKDPLGLMIAAAGGAAGGAGQGYAAHTRDTKTLSGRTLRTIEESGGQVKAFGKSPVEGGLYETPEVSQSKVGRAGVNEMADQAQTRIQEHNAGKLAASREAYGQQSDAILTEHAQRKYDFANLHKELNDVEAQVTASNGVVGDRPLKNAIDQVKAMTTKKLPASNNVAGGGVGWPEMEFPMGTVEDLIKAQRVVKSQAQYGSIPTAENRPYRLIDHILNEQGKDIDPRLRVLKADYAKTMNELGDANDILYGTQKPDVNMTAAKERAAALRIGRVGDETQAATGASQRQIEELKGIDPAYARELKLIEAKKAAERIRYGGTEVSMPIEKGMAHGASHALLPVGAAAAGAKIGGAVGGPVGAVIGGAAGHAAGKAIRNPLATQVRIKLPVADAAGRQLTGASGARANRLTELQRLRDEEERRRAAFLSGGP